MSNQRLNEIIIALEKWFAAKEKVAVAFSGGVDSSLLFFLGSRVLGSRCKGFFANTPLLAGHQVAGAVDFADHHNLSLEERLFSPLNIPGFSENKSDRCYICKKGLYQNLQASLSTGWSLVDGTNIDDDPDQRPGSKAIVELKVATPFLDCGVGKRDIRKVSQILGLSTWNKPSDSCLATRIPQNTYISRQALQSVENAEADLRSLGFEGMRANIHGDTVLLTFNEGDLERALTPELRRIIQKKMAARCFLKVFLDLSERPGILP